MRIPLYDGCVIKLSSHQMEREFQIEKCIGKGATCLVYEALCFDEHKIARRVRIKELFPSISQVYRENDEIIWECNKVPYLEEFKKLYNKHIEFQNDEFLGNSMAHVIDFLYAGNGTYYIVIDIDNGWTMDQDGFHTEDIKDSMKSVIALTKLVSRFHQKGYLILDIKPQNILILPETRDYLKFIDLDGIICKEEIVSGNIRNIPYSIGWSSPEQVQGKVRLISEKSDVFSIGAVLFERLMGRTVENDDTSIFAEYSLNEEILSQKVKRALVAVFKQSLAASPKKRYLSVDNMLSDLSNILELLEEKTFLQDRCPASEIYFVGRKRELEQINQYFDSGKKTVFLHGMGGIGKSELSLKYAETNPERFDCRIFLKYEGSVENMMKDVIINGIEVASYKEKLPELKKLCNDRVLFILDNWDVEPGTVEGLDELFELNAKFIVTTRCDYSEEYETTSAQIDVDVMEQEELLDVFLHYCSLKLSDNERTTLIKIFCHYGYLTYIVVLIAKYMAGTECTVEEFYEKVDKEGLGGFSDGTDEVRHRKDGKSRKLTLMGHMRDLYRAMELTEEHKQVLVNLSFLGVYNRLTKKVYKKVTSSKNLNALRHLINIGWIQEKKVMNYYAETTDKYLDMHSSVKELIIADLDPKPENATGIISYIETEFRRIDCVETAEGSAEFYKVLALYIEFMDIDSNVENKYRKLSKLIYRLYCAGVEDIIEHIFQGSNYVSTDSLKYIANESYFIDKIATCLRRQLVIQVDEKTFNVDHEILRELIAVTLVKIQFDLSENRNTGIYFDILDNELNLLTMLLNIVINELSIEIIKAVLEEKDDKEITFLENIKLYNDVIESVPLEKFVVSIAEILNHNFIVDGKYAFKRDKRKSCYNETWPIISNIFINVAKINELILKYSDNEKMIEKHRLLQSQLGFEILYSAGWFNDPFSYANFDTEEFETEYAELYSESEGARRIYEPVRYLDKRQHSKLLATSLKKIIEESEESKIQLVLLCLDWKFLLDQPATIRNMLSKNDWLGKYIESIEWSEHDRRLIFQAWINNLYELISERNVGKKELKAYYSKVVLVYKGLLGFIRETYDYFYGSALPNETIDVDNCFAYIVEMLYMDRWYDLDFTDTIQLIHNILTVDSIRHTDKFLNLTRVLYSLGKRKFSRELKEQLLNLYCEKKEKFSRKNHLIYILLMKNEVKRMHKPDVMKAMQEDLKNFNLEDYQRIIESDASMNDELKTRTIRAKFQFMLERAALLIGEECPADDIYDCLLADDRYMEDFSQYVHGQVPSYSYSAEVVMISLLDTLLTTNSSITSFSGDKKQKALYIYKNSQGISDELNIPMLHLLGILNGSSTVNYILNVIRPDIKEKEPELYDALVSYPTFSVFDRAEAIKYKEMADEIVKRIS